jgi:hypothetical protein
MQIQFREDSPGKGAEYHINIEASETSYCGRKSPTYLVISMNANIHITEFIEKHKSMICKACLNTYLLSQSN